MSNPEVERLNQLARVFLAVDSPQQLADCMIEGGVIVAALVLRKALVFDDMVYDMAKHAKQSAERPEPLWDTSVADQAYQFLFCHVADRYSDRPKSIRHIEKQQGSAVWLVTKWAEDYKPQAHRYSMFCVELAAELIESPTEPEVKPEVESVDLVALPDPDGLSPDGLTLRWGGELYPLSKTAAIAVGLLFESYNKGFPYLHEDYLKDEGEFFADMRGMVADNKLTDVVVRQTVDGKRVNGKWGLVAPKEKN